MDPQEYPFIEAMSLYAVTLVCDEIIPLLLVVQSTYLSYVSISHLGTLGVGTGANKPTLYDFVELQVPVQ